MNREAWQHVVHAAKNGDEALFSKAVSSNFENYFYKAINKFTQEADLTNEIYICVMTKFWERFILSGEELPESNVDGYIFQMAKNAFFEMKRKQQSKKHGFICSVDSLDIVEKYSAIVKHAGTLNELDAEKQKNETITQLHEAVQLLDEKCKEIIDQNIVQNITLTVLKDELGITGSYNAIVQKKKRCLQMLKKVLLRKLKNNSFSSKQLTT